MTTLIPETDLLKVYIAGPMRGIKDFNRKEFNRAEKFLKRIGIYDPINPARLDKESGMSDAELISKKGLRKAMKRDIDALFKCNVVFMLTGWEKSEGAKIEHRLATMLGMTILYQ
tara:strand:- start:1693 stop:2037 length:345 start_codon:yes stop_codon:yes gene_type:complete